jgi:membrane associated rhomboid family serine protease
MNEKLERKNNKGKSTSSSFSFNGTFSFQKRKSSWVPKLDEVYLFLWFISTFFFGMITEIGLVCVISVSFALNERKRGKVRFPIFLCLVILLAIFIDPIISYVLPSGTAYLPIVPRGLIESFAVNLIVGVNGLLAYVFAYFFLDVKNKKEAKI